MSSKYTQKELTAFSELCAHSGMRVLKQMLTDALNEARKENTLVIESIDKTSMRTAFVSGQCVAYEEMITTLEGNK